jgi:hypothetical protein
MKKLLHLTITSTKCMIFNEHCLVKEQFLAIVSHSWHEIKSRICHYYHYHCHHNLPTWRLIRKYYGNKKEKTKEIKVL